MALSSHVNADELMKAAEDHPHLSLLKRAGGGSKRHAFHTSHYGRYQCVLRCAAGCFCCLAHTRAHLRRTEPIPKYSLPSKGINADAAYNVRTPGARSQPALGSLLPHS